jgi:4-hydroxy-tetrahydrodipicolinate synthase
LQAAVPGVPIVLGVSQSSTAAAVDQARRLATLQPAGLLVTAPPYVRPSQQGVRRHIEAVVAVADLPVLIYNIPYRTGVNIELGTLRELARDPRVAGIKECGGTAERMLRLVHETPLHVLSGDDSQNFMAMCLGAHGAIAAAAHVLPQWHVRIHDLLRRRDQPDLVEARRLAVALQPLIQALFAEPNPAPLKALLAHLGWCQASVREPFSPVSAELQARVVAEWNVLQPTLR